MSGYIFDGSSCVYKSTTYNYPSTYSTNSSSCPLNSSQSLTDSTKCNCNTGYQLNATKDACVVAPVISNDQACSNTYGVNSNWDGTKTSADLLNCGCQSGYSWNSTKTACVSTPTKTGGQLCKDAFGSNSGWNGTNISDGRPNCICQNGYAWNSGKTACIAQSYTYTPPPVAPTTYTASSSTGTSCTSFGAGAVPKGSLCYCSAGYKWNSSLTACVVGGTTLQRNLTIGSSGSDVVALKNFLAVLNLYSGYVSAPFDTNTVTAVELFQATHGIPLTGTVGPMTRASINALINGS